MRAGEGLSGDAVGGEFRVERVGDGHVEPLHRFAAVLHILDEHAGGGGVVRVEVGAERPCDVRRLPGFCPAGTGDDERVFLVGIVADGVGVVLRIDDWRGVCVG